MYTLIGRAAMNIFQKEDSKFFFMRIFVKFTNPVLKLFSKITPEFLANIPAEAMAGFAPEQISNMPADCMAGLSIEQLGNRTLVSSRIRSGEKHTLNRIASNLWNRRIRG